MTWKVELRGDMSDLDQLARSFTGTDINIAAHGKEYLLTSERFDHLEEADQVRNEALVMVAVLDGGCRLALNSTKTLMVGAVYRYDAKGGRSITVFPEPAVFQLRTIGPTVTLTRSDGGMETFHPADVVRDWARIALSSSSVKDVFELIRFGELDWVNLYKIIEIIEDDVGGGVSLERKKWVQAQSIRLFKRTANCRRAIGSQARHGHQRFEPPRTPMTLAGAQSLIKMITRAWLQENISGG